MRTIAIVANSGWNIYNYRIELIRALKRDGWHVIIFCPRDEYLDRLPEDLYDTFVHLRWLAPRSVTPLKDIRLIRELKRGLKTWSPDLILTFTFKPNIFTALATRDIPVVGTVTGLGSPFIKGGILRFIALRLYAMAYGSSGLLFFHNSADRELFISEKVISKDRSAVVAGSGIDTKGIVPQEHILTGRMIFLFLGRVMREKGVRELLMAANELVEQYSSVSLILAGHWVRSGGMDSEEFKMLTTHSRIRYLGHIDDLESIWSITDCLVLPSYREGMSRSVIEAMARGIPVIASDVPGCRELVGPDTGLLAPVGDHLALKEAMETMIRKTSDERMEMGRLARIRIENSCSVGAVYEKYKEVIERCLQNDQA